MSELRLTSPKNAKFKVVDGTYLAAADAAWLGRMDENAFSMPCHVHRPWPYDLILEE